MFFQLFQTHCLHGGGFGNANGNVSCKAMLAAARLLRIACPLPAFDMVILLGFLRSTTQSEVKAEAAICRDVV